MGKLMFGTIIVLLLCLVAVETRKAVRERRARKLHAALSKKMDEMIDDPFTFERDWKAFLPVAKYADEVINKDLVWTNLPSLAARVMRYLDEDPELQDA